MEGARPERGSPVLLRSPEYVLPSLFLLPYLVRNDEVRCLTKELFRAGRLGRSILMCPHQSIYLDSLQSPSYANDSPNCVLYLLPRIEPPQSKSDGRVCPFWTITQSHYHM